MLRDFSYELNLSVRCFITPKKTKLNATQRNLPVFVHGGIRAKLHGNFFTASHRNLSALNLCHKKLYRKSHFYYSFDSFHKSLGLKKLPNHLDICQLR